MIIIIKIKLYCRGYNNLPPKDSFLDFSGSEDRLEDIVIYAEDPKQRIIPVYTEDETVIKTEHVQ